MIHSIYIFSRVLTKDFKLIYLSLIGKIFLYIKVKYIFCEHRVCSFWQNIHFIFKVYAISSNNQTIRYENTNNSLKSKCLA